jgi:ribosome-associated protein
MIYYSGTAAQAVVTTIHRITSLHTAHRRNALEALELARSIVELTTQVMASDVHLLDISALTVIADYFVIVTGDSDRQLQAIADHTVEQLRDEHDIRPLAVEGVPASGWLLVDYGSVILHIFSPQQRAYYRLEELWSAGRTIVRLV